VVAQRRALVVVRAWTPPSQDGEDLVDEGVHSIVQVVDDDGEAVFGPSLQLRLQRVGDLLPRSD